ncbi:hypothetical protein, conserved [Plasmodium vivax]|uniref:mRNA methyltransferase n=1 Tax=Plasmodium vivax (strain Salvador I) TaxID=126793 RepID=A5K8L8_PLAVS|nr:hypothetical protein, conserved [Plasmodium vivax]EDL44164.1 hypothetical protein, conserved [Plasmodium vivax]|eukprot:XP_001613891.1 hypothetical protein [Plasmodium vivax Sal-1]
MYVNPGNSKYHMGMNPPQPMPPPSARMNSFPPCPTGPNSIAVGGNSFHMQRKNQMMYPPHGSEKNNPMVFDIPPGLNSVDSFPRDVKKDDGIFLGNFRGPPPPYGRPAPAPYRLGGGPLFQGEPYPVEGYPSEMYQGEMYQGEMYQGEMYQGEMYQGEMYQGETYQGETYQGETYQGEMYQGEMYQGETYQGETYQGETYQGETYPGGGYPGGGYPFEGYPGEAHQGDPKNEGKGSATTYNINVDGRERLQNDYNQNFVNTGERPQNFIRDSDENKRFDKYPKLKQLLELKNQIIKKRSTPARYINCDLRSFDLGTLGTKFDVILIDPPWKEYYDRKIYNLDLLSSMHIENYDLNGDINNDRDKFWSLEDLASLEIEKIADVPSFLFLWCGITHLEDARVLLNKWGYRRCEDICWLKTNIKETNKKVKYLNETNNENSFLQRTTEHCLVGIKGAVRRSYDIHFIHANLDTDVIIAEETDENIYNNNKPEELYKIIEKFCLGRRKIELFGTNRNIRNGWLTLGKNLDTTLFNREEYTGWFEGDVAWPEATSYVGGKYMGTTTEIENLRPKSPPRSAT